MVDDFAKDHPAKNHPRSRSKLRDAYFGAAPVGSLVVATHRERVIGMVLAGLAPREIVRRLPDPSLNKVAARARG
jgi:hypothetical protein